ncbi:MAG TPA: MarR family winged helix-turn-helix transcriptional regulator, partial [Longimicrobium sp.]|nr:MarR family winged helix-turn-helix transcriptional regulator [Longimicrobium sp.]
EEVQRSAATTAAVDAVRRMFRTLRMAAQQTQQTAGISAAQLFVLSTLASGAASSLTELGERTHTDRTSVAGVVARLAAAGLVKRCRSRTDRRRMEVRITPAGRALLDRAPAPPTALLIAGMDALDDDTLASLAGGLGRLASAMGLEGAPAPMLFEEDEAMHSPTVRRRVRNG